MKLPMPVSHLLEELRKQGISLSDNPLNAVVGVIDPSIGPQIVCEPIDTNTPEWRAFAEVFDAVIQTRHPSQDMIEELDRRRQTLVRSVELTFSRLRFQLECEGEPPNAYGSRNQGMA